MSDAIDQSKNIFLNLQQFKKLALALAPMTLLFIVSKPLFFTILFCLLILVKDYVGDYLKKGSAICLNDLAMIFLSYAYAPMYGVIAVLFSLFSKLIFARLNLQQFHKTLLMIGCCYLIPHLRVLGIAGAGLAVVLLRYGAEYLLSFLFTGSISFKDLFYRAGRTTILMITILLTQNFLLSVMI